MLGANVVHERRLAWSVHVESHDHAKAQKVGQVARAEQFDRAPYFWDAWSAPLSRHDHASFFYAIE